LLSQQTEAARRNREDEKKTGKGKNYGAADAEFQSLNNKLTALDTLSQVRDARRPYLPGGFAMGRSLLVAQGALEHAVAAACPAFHGCQLERIVGPDPRRIVSEMSLTPRELLVLRLASNGHRTRRIAQLLEVGEETVKSHLKKGTSEAGR
jgi:DNA-binding CsgD family transcriptional regulator